MAFLLDTFIRANEAPLASPWVADTTGAQQGISLVSNAAAAGPSANNRSLSYRNDSSVLYSQVRYKTVSATNNDSGPLICEGGGNDQFYYGSLFVDAGHYSAYIAKRVAGVWTDLYYTGVDVGFTPAVGNWLRLWKSNTTIYLDYHNGTSWVNVGSTTDSTFTSGADGMRIGAGTPNDDATFDRWANYDTFSTITPTQGALAIAGNAPTITNGASSTRQPTQGALALTGNAPTLLTPRTITPTVGALAIAGQNPAVSSGGGISLQPGAGALSLSGIASTVTLTLPSPATADLLLVGGTPGVTVSSGILIQPAAGALALTGNTPSLLRQDTISPLTGAMALSGQLASVGSQGIITPVGGAASLAGLSPVLTQQLLKTPTPGALALSGGTPTVSVTTLGTIFPATGSLSLSGSAPGLIRLTTIAPTAGALSLTGLAPVIDQTGPKSFTIPTGSLSFTGLAPTVANGSTPGPGEIQVPQFLGMLLSDAVQLAANTGFTNITAVQIMSNRSPGLVLQQNYPYGTSVLAGIALVLTVADGYLPANTIDTRPYPY